MSDFDDELEEFEQKARGAVSVKVPLSVPIKIDGAEANEITLRRPRAGDVREMQETVKGSDSAKTLWLLARMAGCNPKDLDQCDLADLDICEAVLAGFRAGRVGGG